MRISLAARLVFVGVAMGAYDLPAAATLEEQLQDGTRLQIDTSTQTATVQGEGGYTQPLWDGVHTLKDGSIITVRSGVVVPNVPMLESRQPVGDLSDRPGVSRTDVPTRIGTACVRLVEKVCGIRQECTGRSPCSAAQQLLEMEKKEKGGSNDPTLIAASSHSCAEALVDEAFFVRCAP